MTADKVTKIQEAARLTIGNSSLTLQLQLTQLIETIKIKTLQIDQAQKQINLLMEEIESPIMSITGIRQRLGTVILAEIKNINNFRNPAQLQAFAGLETSIYQSGTMNVTGHMIKRGPSYLHYALILAAQALSRFYPPI